MVVLMESIHVTCDDQARYALLSALVDLRVAELVAALERHEADRANWKRPDVLVVVEEELGRLVEALGQTEARRSCRT
jgi:hypothetical protein